jgi:WS/DGAT/MGAT family acyltransferase
LAKRPLQTVKAVSGLGLGLARRQLRAATAGSDPQPVTNAGARLFSGPRLPFNTIPHGIPHKSTAWTSVSMADIKRIRQRHDCTVNDIALAITTAALRRWLIDHDALPAGPITCGNPANTRTVDDSGAFENRFAIFALKLPVEVEDSVERLRVIHRATTESKDSVRGSGSNTVENLFGVLAPGFTELVVGGVLSVLRDKAPSPFNTLVTNVQGPPIPLYLAGAKLDRMSIQMMQTSGMSLIVAVMTYAGQMFVTVVGHRENTPDIWTITEEMSNEVDRLLAAPAAER